LKEAGQIEAAREAYDRVVTVDPTSAVGYCFLGHALQLLGRPQEAGEAFRQSIALDSRMLEFCHSDSNASPASAPP
jgi:Tfp pilus assembly protein PilF